MTSQVINKQDIAKSFGRAATSYDSVAHFQRWVGETLLEKKQIEKPDFILDLGCGTGYFAPELKACYPEASYIGLDLSEQMLGVASTKHGEDAALWLAGDAEKLPFADGSIDLVYSSLAIQWCADLPGLFREIERVLSPKGQFMFSTLLDGSLKELKASWAEVDKIQQHVNEFPYLAEYRDAATHSGLSCLALDEEQKVLEYQQVRELTRELKLLGAHNITSDRPKHLTGKARIRAFVAAYEKFRLSNNILPATYQVLFGVVTKG